MKNKKLYLILLMLPALACYGSNKAQATITPTRTITPITATAAPMLYIPSPTPEAETLCQVKTGIDAGLLNLRDGPSMSYKPLEVLHEGDPITLLEDPARGEWIKIKSLSFQGWVNSNYVTCEKEK